jgi:hypothetical protein
MNPVTGLALGRVAIGALCLADPAKAMRLFQLDPEANPQLPYLSRMFGAREVALGLTTLLAGGTARRNLVAAGLMVDGSDAVAAVLAAREGTVSNLTGAMLAAPAVGAVVAGVAGFKE